MAYKSNDRCLDKAGDDEPIFVFRAQDALMIPAIRYWLGQAQITLTPDHYAEVIDLLDTVAQWQADHANQVKAPD